MHNNKIIPQPDVKTQGVAAFGQDWQQSAMVLPEPSQASLAPVSGKAYTEANRTDKAHSGPQSSSRGSLSLVERLKRRQLKFEQLFAKANDRWKKFWLSQILSTQAQLAELAANDLDLAGKLKHRLTNYESKLTQEKNGPWVTFYEKEILDCQTKLEALEGAK